MQRKERMSNVPRERGSSLSVRADQRLLKISLAVKSGNGRSFAARVSLAQFSFLIVASEMMTINPAVMASIISTNTGLSQGEVKKVLDELDRVNLKNAEGARRGSALSRSGGLDFRTGEEGAHHPRRLRQRACCLVDVSLGELELQHEQVSRKYPVSGLHHPTVAPFFTVFCG